MRCQKECRGVWIGSTAGCFLLRPLLRSFCGEISNLTDMLESSLILQHPSSAIEENKQCWVYVCVRVDVCESVCKVDAETCRHFKTPSALQSDALSLFIAAESFTHDCCKQFDDSQTYPMRSFIRTKRSWSHITLSIHLSLVLVINYVNSRWDCCLKIVTGQYRQN